MWTQIRLLLYAKCKFEKFARRCSRWHKQTTFSDAVFLGTLRVKILLYGNSQLSAGLTDKYSILLLRLSILSIFIHWGVVGCGKGVVYLVSPGHPNDIGWLAILVAGKGRGECFYFFCFLFFIPVPLSSLSLSFISFTISSFSFLPFSERWHEMTQKGWRVIKPQHNQNLHILPCALEDILGRCSVEQKKADMLLKISLKAYS